MAGPKKKQLKRIIIVNEVAISIKFHPLTKLTNYVLKVELNKNKKLHDENTKHFKLIKTC